MIRQRVAGGGSVYLECHWSEFGSSDRHWQGDKVLFPCWVCVNTVYLLCFKGVALFFLVFISVVFHRMEVRWSAKEVYILVTWGCRLESATGGSIATTPALSLP